MKQQVQSSLIFTPSFQKTTHRFLIPLNKRNRLIGYSVPTHSTLDPQLSFAKSFARNLRHSALEELHQSFRPATHRNTTINHLNKNKIIAYKTLQLLYCNIVRGHNKDSLELKAQPSPISVRIKDNRRTYRKSTFIKQQKVSKQIKGYQNIRPWQTKYSQWQHSTQEYK